MPENLHHSNPPITIVSTPRIRGTLDLRGDSVAASVGVTVAGDGVMDGLGDGVIVTGLGVNVAVAGGATRRSNF